MEKLNKNNYDLLYAAIWMLWTKTDLLFIYSYDPPPIFHFKKCVWYSQLLGRRIVNQRIEVRCIVYDAETFVHDLQLYRPGSDAALPNLKKSRRVSIAGGDRKKGGFWFIYPSNTFPIKEMF